MIAFNSWTVEDLPKIAELEKEIFQQFWTLKMLEDSFLLNNILTIVAKDMDGHVLGYIFGFISDDSVEIANIAVHPAYMRQKIGTQLLEEFVFLARQKQIQSCYLEVRVSNSSAMQMYLKNGFIGKYARLRYYHDGEDALVMQKMLL